MGCNCGTSKRKKELAKKRKKLREKQLEKEKRLKEKENGDKIPKKKSKY